MIRTECHDDPPPRKKLTREAVKIDGSEKGEKLNPVFREFGEVLVDHLQGAFKYTLHDGGNVVFHQRLRDIRNGRKRPRVDDLQRAS